MRRLGRRGAADVTGGVARTLLIALCVAALLCLPAAFVFGPAVVARLANGVLAPPPYPVPEEARALHDRMLVADMHADSLLWNRDLLARARTGHVDVPRLIEANVALQVFSAVTQVPFGLNYERNPATAPDLITALAILQRWPRRTWTSRTERALYQAEKLAEFAARSGGRLRIIRSAEDLYAYLEARASNRAQTAAVLAIEGLQAADGDLANLERLRAAGFRVMGISHFFDTAFGGSAHGTERGGLTDLGRAAVHFMLSSGIAIDLAHASPAVFDEVLALTSRPVLVSHGGVRGTCDNVRNLSDMQIRKVAAVGGVVGIGYWDQAVCDPTLEGIVRAIRHAIEVGGVDHVGLGSDFDGATHTPFDTTGVPRITAALLDTGLTPRQVAKIMGGNVLRVLRANLPAGVEAPPPQG